jgi:hypothetical protein
MTIAPLFNFLLGRATTFAIVFTTAGIALAFMGKLDANYVALVAAIQTLIFAHSVKEDYFDTQIPPKP